MNEKLLVLALSLSLSPFLGLRPSMVPTLSARCVVCSGSKRGPGPANFGTNSAILSMHHKGGCDQ
eukprot:2809816-Amphidinium_carterae.1